MRLQGSGNEFAVGVNNENTSAQLVDFGTVTLPFTHGGRGPTTTLSAPNNRAITAINIQLYASKSGLATTCVVGYDLIFIPTDEMVFGAEAPDLSAPASNVPIIGNNMLIYDGGLNEPHATIITDWFRQDENLEQDWITTTPLPELPTGSAMIIPFLFYEAGSPIRSSFGQGAMVSLYTHNRWTQLRGAE